RGFALEVRAREPHRRNLIAMEINMAEIPEAQARLCVASAAHNAVFERLILQCYRAALAGAAVPGIQSRAAAIASLPGRGRPVQPPPFRVRLQDGDEPGHVSEDVRRRYGAEISRPS